MWRARSCEDCPAERTASDASVRATELLEWATLANLAYDRTMAGATNAELLREVGARARPARSRRLHSGFGHLQHPGRAGALPLTYDALEAGAAGPFLADVGQPPSLLCKALRWRATGGGGGRCARGGWGATQWGT